MKIKSNIALSETGFVFNPNTGESFTLNTSGMEIFQMLRENRDPEEILRSVLERYEIEKDLAEKDLDDFIHHLSSSQILDTDE